LLDTFVCVNGKLAIKYICDEELSTVKQETAGELNMTEELDTKGLMCPMPIVKLAKKMKGLDVGAELLLLADDEGAKEDVPAWCRRTGNELVSTVEEGGVFKFQIKKVK